MVNPMSDRQPRKSGPILDPDLWVDQHGDFLFQFALARVGSREAAEDLVQDTFLAAYRAQKAFSGQSVERTWFIGILKHKIVDHFRTKGRERTASELGSSDEAWAGFFDQSGRWQVKPADWGEQPGAALERQEFWSVFRRCLSELPQRLAAAAFALREVDQLSPTEVCEVLNVTPGNLRVLLHRARMQLRRCLECRWFQRQADEV